MLFRSAVLLRPTGPADHTPAVSIATLVERRRLVAAVLTLVLALALCSVAVSRAVGRAPADDVAARCERALSMSHGRATLDTGTGPDVVVIGDSYAVGAGTSMTTSWPTRLPGRVHVHAFSGSGFSDHASPCGAVSYADRAAAAVADHPGALVVVQGGLNDHDSSDIDIERGFVRLMRELAGHPVLVVGPPPAPDRAGEVPRVDGVLHRTAVAFGAAYVSMVDADIDYLDDGLHPSVKGHRQFARIVAREMRVLIR